MLLRRGDRHPSFLEQLHRLFVHTQHGMLRIVRCRISFEHFFHARHELGVLLRRNHPVLDLAFGHAVFFSVLRTVSWLSASTTSRPPFRRRVVVTSSVRTPLAAYPTAWQSASLRPRHRACKVWAVPRVSCRPEPAQSFR